MFATRDPLGFDYRPFICVNSIVMTRLLLISFLLTLVGCGFSELSGSPSVGAGQPAGWPAYGATPGGTHFSAASQITPDNVAWLEQAWVHNSGDFRDAGMSDEGRYVGSSAFQATPILVDETLFYCTPFKPCIRFRPTHWCGALVVRPRGSRKQELALT